MPDYDFSMLWIPKAPHPPAHSPSGRPVPERPKAALLDTICIFVHLGLPTSILNPSEPLRSPSKVEEDEDTLSGNHSADVT